MLKVDQKMNRLFVDYRIYSTDIFHKGGTKLRVEYSPEDDLVIFFIVMLEPQLFIQPSTFSCMGIG